MARARVVWALMPLLGVAGVVAATAWWAGAAWSALLMVGCVAVPPALLVRRARAVWWRLRWPWDARAGGLSRVAELGVEQQVDYRPSALECAPPLVRVDVDRYGRRYLLRPLPGQGIADFEVAIPLLTVRWRASQVIVRPADGRRGRVVLEVTPGDAVGRVAPMPQDVLP